jgi:predicted secreted protein
VSLWHARAGTATAAATAQLPSAVAAARNAAAAAALVQWYLSALTAACSSEKSKVFDAAAVEQIAKDCTELSACIEKWGRDGSAAAMQGSTQVRHLACTATRTCCIR